MHKNKRNITVNEQQLENGRCITNNKTLLPTKFSVLQQERKIQDLLNNTFKYVNKLKVSFIALYFILIISIKITKIKQ